MVATDIDKTIVLIFQWMLLFKNKEIETLNCT